MLKHILNYKLTVLGAAVLLAGCTTTPLDTFSLSSSPQVQVSQKRKNVQILVPTPAALKALDSENIVIHDARAPSPILKGRSGATV